VNGHTNGAAHLVGDIRPQEFRHRIETPSLRGVNIQRLFGSQRALKTVEDFTEFEQRAAYFDGDPVIATKKGVNILDRGSQVHFMAEFEELMDFRARRNSAWTECYIREGRLRQRCAGRRYSLERRSGVVPSGAVLYRQPHAQLADGAFL
jgi:cytochrome c peroxidase